MVRHCQLASLSVFVSSSESAGSALGYFTSSVFNAISMVISLLYLASILSVFGFYFTPSRNSFDMLADQFVDMSPLVTGYK